jgi:hypothetical protein
MRTGGGGAFIEVLLGLTVLVSGAIAALAWLTPEENEAEQAHDGDSDSDSDSNGDNEGDE